MNRKFIILLGIILGILILAVTGCDEFATEDSFYKTKADREKLHSLENFSLTSKKQEPNAYQPKYMIDVNRPQATELKLTLEQCRVYTLANNLDLKVQLVAPAIAAEQVNEEEAKFEAAVYSNVQTDRFHTPTATELQGTNVEQTNVDLGVKVPLKTGGTINVNLADDKFKTDNTFATINPAYSSTASVSISQPLLRGAGKRVNTYAIRVANYNLSTTEARTKLEVIRVLADADRVYWRLYAAKKVLEVRQKEFEVAEAELEKTKRLVSHGLKPAVEVVRAESGVAARLQNIILADNQFRDEQREAKRIMNIPSVGITTDITLLPATEPDPVRYEIKPNELVAKATENRMEMLELELQIAQQAEAIDFYGNQALPLVNLDYTYHINGLGPSRHDSYDMLFDRKFDDHLLGFTVSVPLGNEEAKSRIREAFYRRKQSIATKEQRRAIIETEVLRVTDQLEADWQSILAARQSTILAAKVFEAEQRQYEKGLRTMTEVLNAQAVYTDAASSEIAALTQYQIAQVDLAYATGTILGSAKVRWQQADNSAQ